MRCAVCGSEAGKLAEGLCSECYRQRKVRVELPSMIAAEVCRQCLGVLRRGRWHRGAASLEEAVEEAGAGAIEDSLRVSGLSEASATIRTLKLSMRSPREYAAEYSVRVSGLCGCEQAEVEAVRQVRVRLTLCGSCHRRASKYYEAVLQVRAHGGLSEELREELAEAVHEEVQRRKEQELAFITMQKELKEGTDFYFGSAKIAKQVAVALQRRYGGSIKVSTTLAGVSRSGKTLKRYTFAYRMPRFRAGDVLMLGGTAYQVLGVSAGRLRVLNLKSRQKHTLPESLAEGGELIGRAEEAIPGVVTDTGSGGVEVMEMQGYSTVFLVADVKLRAGDEVKLLIDSDGRYHLLATPEEAEDGRRGEV